MSDKIDGNSKRKMRSPNFPSIPLEEAIDLARKLWDRNKMNAVAYDFAIGTLKYSPKSSAGVQALAALASYGLISVKGMKKDRRVSVSDLAYKIILDMKPDSPSRMALLRQAALNPIQFIKIKEEYPSAPPDMDSLIYDLPPKYKFNPSAARDFASVFLKTMEFAKVYEYDIISDESKASEDTIMIGQSGKTVAKEQPANETSRPPIISAPSKEREKAMYSLGGDLKVRIIFSGSSNITDKSIEKLMNLLQINKEDFIESPPDAKETN